MKKIYLNLILLFGLSYLVSAQTTDSIKSNFVPGGKPIVTVYSDFSHVSSNGRGNNAFEISRAYLGYGYSFSSDFSGKIVFDVANTAGLSPSAFTAFLKNAYGEYSHRFLKVDVGMIGESMFDLQESIWGKRYLYKSFQDQYGFGYSADLGAKVKILYIPQVSLDLEVLNGEGYKKVQSDSTLQLAVGLTLQPIKNLYARVYFDYLNYVKVPASVGVSAQSSFNVFVGYKSELVSLGAEYNLQKGHGNVSNHNFSGVSLYGTLPILDKFTVFARFDDLMSDKIGTDATGWNTTTDGKVYMAGIEFFPVKWIQISPNIRYSDLSAGSASTTINLNFGMNF